MDRLSVFTAGEWRYVLLGPKFFRQRTIEPHDCESAACLGSELFWLKDLRVSLGQDYEERDL